MGFGMQVVAGVAGYRDRSGLHGMVIVPMASSPTHLAPPVTLNELDDLADLHVV
jgi:hypothetical protein